MDAHANVCVTFIDATNQFITTLTLDVTSPNKQLSAQIESDCILIDL